jgi:hypothetical protein
MANETMAITIASFMISGISFNDGPCGARKLNEKYNINNESIEGVWVWVSFILAETHPEPSSFQVSTKRSD